MNVLQCKKGPTLSDHDTGISTLLDTKPGLSKRTISYCKLEDISTDEMIKSMNMDSLEVITDLEDLLLSFNKNLQKALDDNAPLKENTITCRN